MIMKLYSVYDVKTGIFYPPQVCHNAGHAIRLHMDIFTQDKNISRYYSDYSVFEIGTFDDQTGELVSSKPSLLMTGAEIIAEFNKIQESRK